MRRASGVNIMAVPVPGKENEYYLPRVDVAKMMREYDAELGSHSGVRFDVSDANFTIDPMPAPVGETVVSRLRRSFDPPVPVAMTPIPTRAQMVAARMASRRGDVADVVEGAAAFDDQRNVSGISWSERRRLATIADLGSRSAIREASQNPLAPNNRVRSMAASALGVTGQPLVRAEETARQMMSSFGTSGITAVVAKVCEVAAVNDDGTVLRETISAIVKERETASRELLEIAPKVQVGLFWRKHSDEFRKLIQERMSNGFDKKRKAWIRGTAYMLGAEAKDLLEDYGDTVTHVMQKIEKVFTGGDLKKPADLEKAVKRFLQCDAEAASLEQTAVSAVSRKAEFLRTKFDEQFNLIQKFPYVLGISLDRMTNVCFRFDDLVIKYGSMNYNLGKYIMKVSLKDEHITAASEKYPASNRPHPHICQNGSYICWGNAAEGVAKLKAEFNFPMLVAMMWSGLHGYNQNSCFSDLENFK